MPCEWTRGRGALGDHPETTPDGLGAPRGRLNSPPTGRSSLRSPGGLVKTRGYRTSKDRLDFLSAWIVEHEGKIYIPSGYMTTWWGKIWKQ